MRVIYLFLFLFAILAFSCSEKSSKNEDTTNPNIIFVITDDQGFGDLGVHGNTQIKTPNLDQLSKESVNFSNFHSATTCAPTRASIMTGMNCNVVGVWHTILGRSFLNASFPTMPELLKEHGYTTGIFGKWHLGDNYPYRPQERGFDEVLIHGGGGVGQTPDYWNNDYFDDTYFHNGEPQKYQGYCTDIWFDEGIKWIRKKAVDDQPFFAYITTNAPHGPYNIMESYIDPYRENAEIPSPNFYGMITNADDNMGKLRKMLEETGLEENTLLVFMTDNGTSSGAIFNKEGQVTKGFNAKMRGKKGSEYEGGHRVPLMMKFPKSMNIENRTYAELTSAMDLLPTFLDLLGDGNRKHNFEGFSFKTLVETGKQASLNERIVVADKQRVDRPVKWKNTSVMMGDWRLVNESELYNIGTDPSQKNNVIDEHKEVASNLETLYDNWWSTNEEAFQQNNYLPVGFSDEKVLLTCHDWVAPQNPPWHQGSIRTAKAISGYWNIDVEKAGKYVVSLYRWPPSTGYGIAEEVALGDSIPGGKPFPVGQGIEVKEARIAVQDIKQESSSSPYQDRFEFEVDLKEGPCRLQTDFVCEDGVRGAYYVVVELAN